MAFPHDNIFFEKHSVDYTGEGENNYHYIYASIKTGKEDWKEWGCMIGDFDTKEEMDKEFDRLMSFIILNESSFHVSGNGHSKWGDSY